MNKNQFDFALDADDPSTAEQAAFMTTPPFSKSLTIKNLDTQKSFLITDVRLRSIARKDESSIYGLDRWALDIYHKLAGYESQPGVNTRVVDQMGHDVYERYDSRAITPDTPTQKTVYDLSAREVDLLIHAGAYDDPANTESKLRKQLVGQTWSMPDRVQVSESKVRIPEQQVMINSEKKSPMAGHEFLVALVQDVGQKTRIDAHTPGSNMAVVMDTALKAMAPGVMPMADIHKDLEMANDVKALSRQHQVKSQVLDNELDFGDSKPKELELAQAEDQQTKGQSTQPTMQSEDANEYRADLVENATKKAGVERDKSGRETSSLATQKHVANDRSQIDEFIPGDKTDVQPSDKQTEFAGSATQAASDDKDMFSSPTDFATADDVVINPDDQSVSSPRNQQRRQTVRNVESAAVQEETASQGVGAQASQPSVDDASQGFVTPVSTGQTTMQNQPAVQTDHNQQSNPQPVQDTQPSNEVIDKGIDLNTAEQPSMDQLQKMLNDLKSSGLTQGYEAPDYEEAADESPAAQRQRLKVKQRLTAQQDAERLAADKAVKQRQAARTNVPAFDGGPDF